ERRGLAGNDHRAFVTDHLDPELCGIGRKIRKVDRAVERDPFAGLPCGSVHDHTHPTRTRSRLRATQRFAAVARRGVDEVHVRGVAACCGSADHEQASGDHCAHDTLAAMPEVGERSAPDLPTTFGKYFLTEKLATGGMAEIYLGKLIGPGGFEKQLVIKQIHPKLSDQRHFVDLFVAEAKILVALAHGNIVPVYELGVVDDIYFSAMDYIDGPTLYRLTETMAGREAKMEPALAAWITARILDGLDYAHSKGEGVIHRDLSPRNVMLSRDGEVKLVDF